jgi:hypothetical protein
VFVVLPAVWGKIDWRNSGGEDLIKPTWK